MLNILKKYKYPFFIIGLIFIIKLITVFYLVYLGVCRDPEIYSGLACFAGDTASYINPIENFINEGRYYYKDAYAGRMPYLGIIYYFFRLALSAKLALNALVIVQILFESISIYYLAKLCRNILPSNFTFILYILFSLISLNVTIYSFSILAESLPTSFLAIFSYHYYKYLKFSRTYKQLLLASFLIAIAILLKPALSILLIVILGEIIHFNLKHKLKFDHIFKNSILILLPIIILNAPWTIRNYIVFNKFIPFQQDRSAGYNYTPQYLSVVEFIQTIGESYVFWDYKAAGSYFDPIENVKSNYSFPSRIFSENLTLNRIEEAKNIYNDFKKSPNKQNSELTILKFNYLTKTFKEENKIQYLFITPFIRIKQFIFHSGSYYLPISKDSPCNNNFDWYIKIIQSCLYYINLVIGFLGLILLVKFDSKYFILLVIPTYLIIIYPVYFKLVEWRYFQISYPILSIGVIYFIVYILKKTRITIHHKLLSNFTSKI